jgi:hypothetical protein
VKRHIVARKVGDRKQLQIGVGEVEDKYIDLQFLSSPIFTISHAPHLTRRLVARRFISKFEFFHIFGTFDFSGEWLYG